MPETALDPETRFWKRITKTEGCWIWTGRLTHEGYGQICTGAGRRPMVHRFSYELLVGPIPEGLVIDHLCRNRACVNPEHLEPVTQTVNALRGVGVGAKNATKTHCPQGHEYSPENTYVGSQKHRSTHRPFRMCRTCQHNRQVARSLRANA